MPNGRNAGRLFADCTNEHGYGESHAFHKDDATTPGSILVCRVCEQKFLVDPAGKLVKTKWDRGPAFAEVAEVFGVATDHIIAIQLTAEHCIAFYTPVLSDDLDANSDPDVVEVVLHRDADGILRETTRRDRPGMWAELRARMESAE